ncbi:MAG: hypothetical protein ACK4GT_07255 [Pararhodobacter sp.]
MAERTRAVATVRAGPAIRFVKNERGIAIFPQQGPERGRLNRFHIEDIAEAAQPVTKAGPENRDENYPWKNGGSCANF